jgi:protein PhnA
MKLEEQLAARCGSKCELCQAETPLSLYEVPHAPYRDADGTAMICAKCLAQLNKKEELDGKHWKCLNDCMWSEVPGIQVISWRMLNRLRDESWAVEQLDMMYMEEDRMEWARATGDHELGSGVDLHKDSNGAVLQDGDSVVLTKSLDVKGSTLNAKMGTVVKNIKLVQDNTEQIEGRVEGQLIVILTKYVRKQGS